MILRRLISLAGVAVLGLVASVSYVSSASAYAFHGCKSTQIEGNTNYYYRTGNGITSYYSSTIDTAAGKWNATNVPGTLKKVSQGGQAVIERYSYTQGWYALSSWHCGSNGYYSGGQGMALNSRTMDPLASWQDRFVIIHEFGHLMGLAHEDDLGVCKAVMRSDAQTDTASCSSTNPPYGDDVNGVNARY